MAVMPDKAGIGRAALPPIENLKATRHNKDSRGFGGTLQ